MNLRLCVPALLLCLCALRTSAQDGILRVRQFGYSVENTFDHVQQTLDKGYFTTCVTYGEPNTKIVKWDSVLNLQWYKVLSYRKPYGSKQLSDSGYIVVGAAKWVHQSSDDFWIARFDKAGNQLWETYYGGNGYDIASAVTVLPSGNFLVAGIVSSNSGDVVGKTTTDSDIWLLELNPAGGLLWQKFYGGSAFDGPDDSKFGMELTSDGGLVFTTGTQSNDGHVTGNHGGSDIWVVKLDNAYNVQWTKTIGGSGSDLGASIKQTPDGYIIGGVTGSSDGDFAGQGTGTTDGALVKLDQSGNVVWDKVFGGPNYDEIRNVKLAANNDILVAGFIDNPLPEIPWPVGRGAGEAIALRMDQSGYIKWSRSVGSSSTEMGNDILEKQDGNIILVGLSWFASTNGDFTNSTVINGGESRGFILEMRNMNSIRGISFRDNNNNNVQDAGEPLFTQGTLRVTKGTYQVTNPLTAGKFLVGVDTGTYVSQVINTGLDSAQFRTYPKRRKSIFTGYGQTDSFAVRVIPTNLVKDLEVIVLPLSSANFFIDHSAKFRIRLRNLGGAQIDTAYVYLKMGGNASYLSSTVAPHSINGDTIVWRYIPFAGPQTRTIDVVLKTGTFPAVQLGDTLRVTAIAGPVATDTDPDDNIAAYAAKILGQNSGITNRFLGVKYTDSARMGRPIQYTVAYNFNSQLDSTFGAVRLVKSNLSTYVTATPAPASITGDTIVWNFKDLAYGNADTIRVTLRINDTPSVNYGTLIQHKFRLLFNTTDTALLFRDSIVHQYVKGYFGAIDTVKTTLLPPQGIQWSRVYGGSGDDVAMDVVALADSGFIVVGQSGSTNGDLPRTGGFITRFSRDGQVVWNKLAGSYAHAYLSTVRTFDKNVFFATGGDSLSWIIKFDLNGNIIWSKTLANDSVFVTSLLPLADGSSYVFGSTTDNTIPGYIDPATGINNSNLWLARLDNNGNILWQKTYTDGQVSYWGQSIAATLDGKLLISGMTEVPLPSTTNWSNKAIAMKLDTDGSKIWETQFYFKGYTYVADHALQGADGSIYVTGAGGPDFGGPDTASLGMHGRTDMMVAKLDQNGARIWTKYFGGSDWDMGNRMSFAPDGNLLVAGATFSKDGNVTGFHGTANTDAWLLKVDTSGKLLWQKTVGGTDMDEFQAVASLADNSIVAVGSTSSMNNGDIHGQHGLRDALITKIGASNSIVGKVYYDKNNNGIQDANEPARATGFVRAVKGGFTYGDDVTTSGFSMSVDSGSYVVTLYTRDTSFANIVPANHTSVFTGYGQTDTVIFRLVRKVTIQDLNIEVMPLSIPRPGFNVKYLVKYENSGTIDAVPATIKIAIDSKTQFVSSTRPYTSVVGDTLIWTIPQLDVFTSGNFTLELKIKPPPTANAGDSIRLYAEILPIVGDTTPHNNRRRIAERLTGSYDPNDKIEVHGKNFELRHLQGKEYLTYVIRFQNTGTDTAFNVYVRDTLDQNLDWNSFEMLAASHAYQLEMNGNKLQWTFSNILLVDSNRNEPLSHGYIAFRILPKTGLMVGDTVRNTASIYFDFNLPVKTNIATTIVTLNAPLPSTVLELTATKTSTGNALIGWVVVNESKVAHYQVEHSVNGVDFTPVGSVKALNGTGRLTYSFVDKLGSAPVNYYRLKIVDIDNSYTYSKIVLLKSAPDRPELTVFPNPVNTIATLRIKSPVKGNASVSVLDMTGKVLMVKQLGFVDAPLLVEAVNMQTLPGGNYTIRLQVGAEIWKVQVVKQ